MTQQALELTPPTEKKPRVRVRETSKAAYADGRARFTGRRANVLRWLAHHFNARAAHPTSAELAHFAVEDSDFYDETKFQVFSEAVLYVRRGISDLQASGVIEPSVPRVCGVTGRMCHTWRVVSR